MERLNTREWHRRKWTQSMRRNLTKHKVCKPKHWQNQKGNTESTQTERETNTGMRQTTQNTGGGMITEMREHKKPKN